MKNFLLLGDHDGYQQKNVTPYIHILVYHVPHLISLYGNIKQFSCQGNCYYNVVLTKCILGEAWFVLTTGWFENRPFTQQ